MKHTRSRDDAGDKAAFLIGAGRSGTTLLYKILSLHPKTSYISNYDNRFKWFPPGLVAGLASDWTNAKLKAWFNAGGNAYFINRPVISRFFPTPVEGESVYHECGIPLVPGADYSPNVDTCACLGAKFENIRQAFSADIFISKRTANNRRLRVLEAIFPRARYVHLIRDGRDVANSLSKVEWWDDHVVWWDGRTARQMEEGGINRLEICARNWVREVQELSAGLAPIDVDRILEVHYEQLLTDPVGQLVKILQFLRLDPIRDYLQAIESLNLVLRPSDWRSLWSSEQLAMVTREQSPDLKRLGYL